MTVFEVVSFVVAFAAAASKWLEVARPVWSKMPAPVATVVPSVVAVLPIIVSKLADTPTTVPALVTAAIAIALAVPGGLAKHSVK